MRHSLGGLGQNAKVVFDESSGTLRIWEKGWIGKRKYRIKANQVSGVMYGWYTSKIRLPMRGFIVEFQHKGKVINVTIPGEHKRFVPMAEEMARSIAKVANLQEYKVEGSNVFFSRTAPSADLKAKVVPTAPDGSPLTKTEQAIAGIARGTKNVAGEIVSDAGNAVSGIAKAFLIGVGAIVFLVLMSSNPVAAVLLLIVGIAVYRKNR
jgi:hypothetical protein